MIPRCIHCKKRVWPWQFQYTGTEYDAHRNCDLRKFREGC